MSVHPRVVYKRRETITELPLYYCGNLLKKVSKEKDFKKYYGELRGATLFLYKGETEDTYSEKMDLDQLKTTELDSPYQKKGHTIFNLNLNKEEVQLKIENPDRAEEWRGYMLTVIKKELPRQLKLLPGQMLQLEEVLDQEKKRNPPTANPPLPPRPSFLYAPKIPPSTSPVTPPPVLPPKPVPEAEVPACFFDVTRQEAERMLESNPECGSIILRPSTLANNYALTLRQMTPSGPVMKNYRVSSTESGFVIELDVAVTVASLNDVLKYFLEKTQYRLHPYMASQPYDTRIDVSPAPKVIKVPTLPAKPVPSAQIAPMVRSLGRDKVLQPPPNQPEDDYVCPDEDRAKDHKVKQELKGELQKVLKSWRKTIDAEKEEEGTYENQAGEKHQLGKAMWRAVI